MREIQLQTMLRLRRQFSASAASEASLAPKTGVKKARRPIRHAKDFENHMVVAQRSKRAGLEIKWPVIAVEFGGFRVVLEQVTARPGEKQSVVVIRKGR